jgi:hypothetical protein
MADAPHSSERTGSANKVRSRSKTTTPDTRHGICCTRKELKDMLDLSRRQRAKRYGGSPQEGRIAGPRETISQNDPVSTIVDYVHFSRPEDA